MNIGTISKDDFARGYSELFAINPKTGKNEKFADVSHKDAIKIKRGYPVGTCFGLVKDIHTGKIYEVYQASCGGDNCNCALTAKEVV